MGLNNDGMRILHILFLFLKIGPPPGSTLFPYTTLFRSDAGKDGTDASAGEADASAGEASAGAVATGAAAAGTTTARSEEHTSELQSLAYLVCRLLLEKKKTSLPSLQLNHLRDKPKQVDL